MITKLEMTLSTAQQNKNKIKKKIKKKTIAATTISNQQQHTHRLRALSRSYWGLKLILMAKSSPYIMLLSKHKNGKLACRLPYLSNVSSWKQSNYYCDETK